MWAVATYALYGLAGYGALGLLLYMLSLLSMPFAGFGYGVLASYLALCICATYGVLASVALRAAGNVGIAQWATARAFKWVMWILTGITFAVDDPNGVLETVRPAVFVGNHQTELDVLMLGCMFPRYCSVTAKQSLRRVPLLGWFMALSGSIFIDRANSRDAREAMRGAADEIRMRRQSVYMFPEGTRSYSKEPMLLPFKKGAFHLAVEAQVPIVPVVAANYSHVLYVKSFIFKRGTIPCKVLDPIPTKGLTAADVEQLTKMTRDLMLREMVALTEKARGRPVPMPAELQDAPSGRSSGVDLKKAS